MRALLLFILALPLITSAQSLTIHGTVVDSSTHQPIAFVSVSVKENKRGVVSDIDGHFSLKNVPANATLIFNCIGYEIKLLNASAAKSEDLVVAISRKADALDEVMVKSDLNPAHRIIRLMQENKKRNDPLSIPSFQYNSYTIAALGATPYLYKYMAGKPRANRFIKPQKEQSESKKKKDSVTIAENRAAVRRFRGNYLFVTESYTERIFKAPQLNRETVLATKVSGFKDPYMAVTSSNFQPFGFYLDFLRMPARVYTSPVIQGSISLYKFNLRQVIPHEKDTTYVISFEPLKGKNFDGLKGNLYINSDRWAIENVTAEPANPKGLLLSFHLQQKYEQIEGRWFPVQLNTKVYQKDAVNDSTVLYWDTKSYIKNIEINKPLKRTDFSDVTFDFEPGAGRKTDSQWNQMRADTLSKREKGTYKAYDSLPKKVLNTFDKMNKFTQIAALQAIPWGRVDLPLRYFISGLNRYEGIRLGVGFQTNRLFSKWISFGGYGGYGFKDNAWKYGANTEFTFDFRTSTKLKFSFSQDLKEPGVIDYFKENNIVFSNQSLRNLYTSRLDSVREWKANFTTKIWPVLQADAWLMTQRRNPAAFPYGFDLNGDNKFVDHYNNTEIGLGLRFTANETYTRVGRAKAINRPATTQIMLQASKGLQGAFDGQLDYTKLALQVNQTFFTKEFGKTTFQAELGGIWGNVPYAYLFNTKGSVNENGKSRTGFFINNSFQTAGVYEFTSDRVASLFIQQNFGSLLFKPKNPALRPEFIFVQNIGYGSISNTAAHQGVVLQAPEKGLFESGLMVRNIIRANMKFFYWGLGVGVFHRYGYYSLPEEKKNWAVKFGLTVSF